jgi:hypothetical protein
LGEQNQTHLLDLLKLMDSEDAPDVSSRCSGLLSEAGRVPGVSDREVGLWVLEPLVHVHPGQRLLRGCDQVLVPSVPVLGGAGDLVQLLVELLTVRQNEANEKRARRGSA